MTEQNMDLIDKHIDLRIDTVIQAKLPLIQSVQHHLEPSTAITDTGPWLIPDNTFIVGTDITQHYDPILNDMTWITDKIEDDETQQIISDEMEKDGYQIAMLKDKVRKMENNQTKMEKQMNELMEEIAKLKLLNEKKKYSFKNPPISYSSGTLHYSPIDISQAGYCLTTDTEP